MHLRSVIVGERHHPGATDHLRNQKIGAAVELRREPDNPYDTNAIRCIVGGKMCGYLPKPHAETLARHIDAGARVRASLADGNRVEIDHDYPEGASA